MTTTSSQRSQTPPATGDPAQPESVAAPEHAADGTAGGENTHVDLGRLAWLATALACLIAVLVLVVEGYYGYAGVTFAVAMSAAINLT
jgi:hypothetical protein